MVDLSVLQSSPEAIAATANWATLMSTMEIQNSNYEFLRDQNDFSSEASKAGANATMASHLQQAYQFKLQAAEAFVQGGSSAGLMAVGYASAERNYGEQINQAQNKSSASEAYLNKINEKLNTPGNRPVVKFGEEALKVGSPGSARTKNQDDQVRAFIRNHTSLDNINDFQTERGPDGRLQLKDENEDVLNLMTDDELETLKTKAASDNKKATKSLETLTTQKQNAIQQFNQIQQMIGQFGSGVTKSMSAASEATRAKAEYLRALLQWIQEGMQTANQITNTAIGQQNERMSGVIGTMSAMVQANKAN